MNISEGRLTKLEKQWILYDVGNSAFILLVSTFIPIYFKNIALENIKLKNKSVFALSDIF